MWSGTQTEYKLVSKFDTLEPNDAIQFFYGDEEPYHVEETKIFAWSGATNFHGFLIANDLAPVQPLAAPTAQLFYLDYTYTYTAKEEIEDEIQPTKQELRRNINHRIGNQHKFKNYTKHGNRNLFKRQHR